MNYFYWYTTIWSAVLLLYSLDWSNINRPLCFDVKLFFLITIPASLIIGFLNRKKFIFNMPIEILRRHGWITFAVVIGHIAEYIYCGQIPLFAILQGTNAYSTYEGIPSFHPLLITFTCFYSMHCFYCWICMPKREVQRKAWLKDAVIMLLMQILLFSRASLMITLFSWGIILYNVKKLHIRPKMVIIVIVSVLVILWGFGVTGNLRSGAEWNDTSIIETIGEYNDNYPSWLSKQYMWAYTYITSPLSNFNTSALALVESTSFSKYCISFLPDFLVKRLFPEYLQSKPFELTSNNLNAVAGFTTYYVYGGVIGLLGMYIYLMLGQLLLLRYLRSSQVYLIPIVVVMCQLVVGLIFYNTIYLSQCSFLLVYALITHFFIFKQTKLNTKLEHSIIRSKL